jgi:hypothetical protein
VIAAADAALFDLAIFERGVAMAAMEMHAAIASTLVAEQDEVFAENALHERQIFDLTFPGGRLPETALIFAARRTRTDLGQEQIGLPRLRLPITAKSQAAVAAHVSLPPIRPPTGPRPCAA